MNQEKATPHISTRDYFKTGEEFKLVYDPKRKILVTTPHPNTDELPKYYDNDSYISHSDDKKGLISFLYYAIKKRSTRKKVAKLQKWLGKKGSVLDIGTGTGEFLVTARDRGWSTLGVEPSDRAGKTAESKGLDIVKNINDIENKTFDAITLWHALEHLPDLNESLNKIENLLKSGGILVVAAPNYESFDARHYKEFWAAFDTPRHLWHFSRASMKNLFSEKIKLLRMAPMIYDSFYISLISEKYKNGKTNYSKAFLIGLLSNLFAWRSKNYSSLIYCFKKGV